MRRLSAALLLLAGLGLSSCSESPAPPFPWLDAGQGPLGFVRADRGPFLGAELGEAPAPARFRLARSLPLRAGEALALDLAVLGPSTLSLVLHEGGGKAVKSFELGLPDPSMRLLLPLEGLRSLGELELSAAPRGGREGKGPLLRIEALRVLPLERGLSREGNRSLIGPGFSLFRRGENLVARLETPFAGLPGGEGLVPALRLRWAPGSAPGRLGILAEGAKPRRLDLRPGASEFLLPASYFAVPPAWIEIEAPGSLDLRACLASSLPAAEARVLDLGVILGLPPPPAGSPFSAFAWDARPSVLVLDFADYAAQDAALKRLAFFVEKAGFRGRLAPDAEIAPLHGWNAHDYRAEDLASFFSKAAAESFPLGPSELAVRELLLGAGILRRGSGPAAYLAGEGALISVSRESPSWLRATFMAHEASHALYFTDPAFAAFVKTRWAALGPEERWFWKLYFGWMNYDTADADLMATEFMAYLYQQPLAKVEEYFTKTLPPRVLENHPDLQARVDEWMARYGADFLPQAEAIAAWLKARYGFEAARPWAFY